MTLILFLCFFLSSLARGLVPPNVIRPLPVLADDELGLAYSQKNEIDITQAPALPTPAPSPTQWTPTPNNPIEEECRTACAVVLPDVTIWNWVPVTITATSVVETIYHFVNPKYFPNVTGTSRLYNYPPQETHHMNMFYTNEQGILSTSMKWGSSVAEVLFPTPITVTQMDMTVVGRPEATGAGCIPATTSTAIFNPAPSEERYQIGSAPTDWNETVKAISDVRHWRLVPVIAYPVSAMSFEKVIGKEVPEIANCGQYGHPPQYRPPEYPENGIQFATTTVTSTRNDTRDPRIAPNIILSKPTASSLDGPGPELDGPTPTQTPAAVVGITRKPGLGGLATAHKENTVSSFAEPTPQLAASAVLAEPTGGSSNPGLRGPDPKPELVLDPGSGIIKGPSPPAVGGKSKPDHSHQQTGQTDKEPAPLVINGHTLTPKSGNTWVTDDGQELKVNGPTIQLSSGTFGSGDKKMDVEVKSEPGGRNILVVNGASMTLADDMAPAATGSSRSGGKSSSSGMGSSGSGSGPGIALGFGSSGSESVGSGSFSNDFPSPKAGSQAGTADAKPAVYKNEADSKSIRHASWLVVVIGLSLFI